MGGHQEEIERSVQHAVGELLNVALDGVDGSVFGMAMSN